MKNTYSIEVEVPIEDTEAAIILIDRLIVKNNINMKLSVSYNFQMKEGGVYRPFEKGQAYRIVINPFICKRWEEIDLQDYDEPFSPGYCTDITIFGVTIHEFCHLLQYKVYKTIIKDYADKFPTERLNLNGYSNIEIHEELAEIMTLYITNPYLLKMISKRHFDFCKGYFKSPVANSLARCAYIYSEWPASVKEHLKNKWGIVYNISSNKFEVVDNGKA